MTADSRLLINVATVFFIKLFTTNKGSLVLTWLNINFKLLIIGCSQARCVSRGTCLECLPPLGKSSASLGWEEALDDQWNDMVSCKHIQVLHSEG